MTWNCFWGSTNWNAPPLRTNILTAAKSFKSIAVGSTDDWSHMFHKWCAPFHFLQKEVKKKQGKQMNDANHVHQYVWNM